MRRKVSGRNGKRSASPDYPERRPQTQNKKRKSNHEKSKHSVQTNSRGSGPAALRLLCGSVCLGIYSGSSPRHGAVQWHCLRIRSIGVRHRVRAFNSRGQLRTREPVGSLHRDSGILPAPCAPNPDLCENNIPYAGTFDWFAANGDEIYGTFEGYLARQKRPECKTTMRLPQSSRRESAG